MRGAATAQVLVRRALLVPSVHMPKLPARKVKELQSRMGWAEEQRYVVGGGHRRRV